MSAQEVRRHTRGAALLQVDRIPEQGSAGRQGDEEPRLRHPRRDLPAEEGRVMCDTE